MISKFDLSKLQDLPIEQVAEALDMTVKHHKTLCPFHSDSRPSLTFNRNKNKYRCYVCNAKGGSIDLVMHMMNLSFRDACHWLAKAFAITISDENDRRFDNVKPRKVVPVRKVEEDAKPDVAYLSRLMAQPVLNQEAEHFLFQERKLSREVILKLGISSISYNCPMSSSPKPTYFDGPALLIPYRDINGNLLSVQSRYLGKTCLEGNTREALVTGCTKGAAGMGTTKDTCLEGSTSQIPRFRFPKGSTCHVFNLNILKNLPPDDLIFITEGVTDCLAMLSAGFASIAIPSATLLKPEDVALLKNRKLHMYPDQDEPGQKLFFDLKALCPQLVYHQLPNGFKDVGQYYSFIHKDDKPYEPRT